jgi:2-C-methyl-D-erythritol 4-phosphate cytidylyltransferase
MKSQLPKQYLELDGKPVLTHTLERFLAFDRSLAITLVVPDPDAEPLTTILAALRVAVPDAHPVCVVQGGATRTQSVRLGLNAIWQATPALDRSRTFVAIHDGVRPFVPIEVLAAGFSRVQRTGAVTCAVPVKHSVRMKTDTGSQNLNRDLLYEVQTPQTFHLPLILEAYAALDGHITFTDDATVAEAVGHDVELTEGAFTNIKLTTPEDLVFAELLLHQRLV